MLLLHGFGDTPQTLALLARRLNDAGLAVRAPLLPGHGTTPDDFFRSIADDWIRSARISYEKFAGECASIGIVGLSMGAAIGAILAAEFKSTESLVLLAPYLGMPTVLQVAARTHFVWNPLIRVVKSRHPDSIRDADERKESLAYGVVNGRVLLELLRIVKRGERALSDVQAPSLVIQSVNDPRVSGTVARRVFNRLGSKRKKLVWVEEGGHVITVDYGRERVFEHVLSWLGSGS